MGNNNIEAPRIPRGFTRRAFVGYSVLAIPILAACGQQTDQSARNTAISQGVETAMANLPTSSPIPNSPIPEAPPTPEPSPVVIPTEVILSPSPSPVPTLDTQSTIQALQKTVEVQKTALAASPTPTLKPTPEATPTQLVTTPTELVNAWIHLRSNTYGSIYELDHPANLTADEYRESGSIFDILTGEKIKGSTTMILIIGYKNNFKSSEEFAKGFVADYAKTNYPNFKDKIIPFRFRPIDGQDTWAIDVDETKITNPRATSDYHRLAALFTENGYGWLIDLSCHPDVFESTLPIFHKILDSFKVIV